jgi:broad specificity phosphatase PhoE
LSLLEATFLFDLSKFMEVYFIRHGQTEWNVERRMQGHNDSPLTEKGIADAKALGKRLAEVNFDLAWCSPSGRTRHTLQLLLNGREVPTRLDDRLLEIDLGRCEGHTRTELAADPVLSHEIQPFWDQPDAYLPSTGESFWDVQKRIMSFFEEIADRYPDQRVLVVTHTTVIKTFLAYVNNENLSQLWKTKTIYPASLSLLKYEGGKWHIDLWGDTAHYEENPNPSK